MPRKGRIIGIDKANGRIERRVGGVVGDDFTVLSINALPASGGKGINRSKDGRSHGRRSVRDSDRNTCRGPQTKVVGDNGRHGVRAVRYERTSPVGSKDGTGADHRSA